jgi:thiamine-phosphate pyrophosphorylase
VLNYAITDRKLFPCRDEYRLNSLVLQAQRWAAAGIDYIQIREKDMKTANQLDLTRRVMAAVRAGGGLKTKVLVNSRADIALAALADGVHLTSAVGELTPQQVRDFYAAAGHGAPLLSISCHSIDEVRNAASAGVDAILFGPIFAKVVGGVEVSPGVGLEKLQEACEIAPGARLFALGGMTHANAPDCLAAGAAGIAAIRLFANL